jgi:predicted nicotinamide N-methyase
MSPDAPAALPRGYDVQVVTVRVGADEYRLRILADKQQYHDPDGAAERAGISSATWPIFGMIWPVGIALAYEMAQFPIEGKRIIEVGCGTALSSLVLRRRGADITASDNHPLAEEFLRHNAQLNAVPPVPYRHVPWGDENPDLGRFDLIIGGDVLYEPDHAALLAGFVSRHAYPAAEVLVADPGRGYRGQFSKRLATEGFTRTQMPCRAGGVEIESKGRILRFTRTAV